MNTRSKTEKTVSANQNCAEWFGAYDSEGKLRATFDSESEAYHYVRNRGHMHQGVNKPITNHAEALAEAIGKIRTAMDRGLDLTPSIYGAIATLANWEGAK